MLLQKFTELFDGWHAAIYVSDFSGAFRAMEAANLIYTEHGFFDANISGLGDAQKFHQFRFQASLCSTLCPWRIHSHAGTPICLRNATSAENPAV